MPRAISNPLETLRVLDRLEVGAPRLEPRRLAATYRVVRGQRTYAAELVYRFEEDVFDPEEPASRNLASMIAAQVALNYGLFCDEIAFLGTYDDTDRELLLEMAANTAREIYVKKFLEPNPFLKGPAAKLKLVRRKSYLRARLAFPGKAARGRGAMDARWAVDRSRHAVLSSGGKDSLLSFALLKELGLDTHPVFVNESGRHWFTALNAYRHLEANCKETTRVWTSSDRVFSFMARHLPFIRADFQDVRADEYPERLWTVAVFSFGVLPVLRKRGLGRLVIGDEYDTTRRLSHHGIAHYDGLYDQSRFFDHALTRYYRRKGWGLSQFSVLRPLSEMIIEKILAERYPGLLRHQVSCHAARMVDGRVRPCGRCEKCRRVVCLLLACGAKPSECGYARDQVKRCLEELPSKGVHQEAEGAEHLKWTLAKKGLVAASALPRPARSRPEVEKLRVDPERSPVEEIPLDLRAPIYRIYLAHTQGAVKKTGRVWVPFDLLADPAMTRPYPFEAAGTGTATKRRRTVAATARKDWLLAEMTWPEARARLRETDVALLPVGAIEQHGPHLPLDTDAWDAEHLARRVAEECTSPRPLVLPLVPYGVSYAHEDFSGTLSVGPDTLSRYVFEIGMSAARHGITKLVILNGHGGNLPTLQFAAQMINKEAHIFTCVDTGETSDKDIADLVVTQGDVHAGEIETSTSLATRPELVRIDRARKFVPRFRSQYMNFGAARRIEWFSHTARISPSGVLGDPTRATREKGQRIWALMVRPLVEFVEALRGTSLDELLHRRY